MNKNALWPQVSFFHLQKFHLAFSIGIIIWFICVRCSLHCVFTSAFWWKSFVIVLGMTQFKPVQSKLTFWICKHLFVYTTKWEFVLVCISTQNSRENRAENHRNEIQTEPRNLNARQRYGKNCLPCTPVMVVHQTGSILLPPHHTTVQDYKFIFNRI